MGDNFNKNRLGSSSCQGVTELTIRYVGDVPSNPTPQPNKMYVTRGSGEPTYNTPVSPIVENGCKYTFLGWREQGGEINRNAGWWLDRGTKTTIEGVWKKECGGDYSNVVSVIPDDRHLRIADRWAKNPCTQTPKTKGNNTSSDSSSTANSSSNNTSSSGRNIGGGSNVNNTSSNGKNTGSGTSSSRRNISPNRQNSSKWREVESSRKGGGISLSDLPSGGSSNSANSSNAKSKNDNKLMIPFIFLSGILIWVLAKKDKKEKRK